jgi:hypothetical protein
LGGESTEIFTPWDQSLKKNAPPINNQFNNTDSTQPSLFASPTKDVFDIMAERNFETLMSYDGIGASPHVHQTNHKLNLVQLEIIEEEKKDGGATGRDLLDEDTSQKKQAVRKPFKGVVNFTINTAMCRSELELIQHVIDLNGFGESQSSSALGHLVWYGLALHPKDIETLLKRKQRPHFNRYPGLELLARKKTFCHIVNRMRKTFPDKIKFCPRSF